MTFDDLYVGMTLDNIDLGSAPQTFKVLEIDRTNKRIYVEGILGKLILGNILLFNSLLV